MKTEKTDVSSDAFFLPDMIYSETGDSPFCPSRFSEIFAYNLKLQLKATAKRYHRSQYHSDRFALADIPVVWREKDVSALQESGKPYVHAGAYKLSYNGRRWVYHVGARICNHDSIPEAQIIGISSPSFLTAVCEVSVGGSHFRVAGNQVYLNLRPETPWTVNGTILLEEKSMHGDELNLYSRQRTERETSEAANLRHARILDQAEKFLYHYGGDITLGYGEESFSWNTDSHPHIAVIGAEGRGKTFLASDIAKKALRSGRAVTCIDVLNNSTVWKDQQSDKGGINLITDIKEAAVFLENLNREQSGNPRLDGRKTPLEIVILDTTVPCEEHLEMSDKSWHYRLRDAACEAVAASPPGCNIVATTYNYMSASFNEGIYSQASILINLDSAEYRSDLPVKEAGTELLSSYCRKADISLKGESGSRLLNLECEDDTPSE